MRGPTQLSADAAAVELLRGTDPGPLHPANIFGRCAPLEVDLGCGDGSFVSQLALENPDRDFLGVERLLGRVRSACKRVSRMELANIRVVRMPIPDVVGHLLPASSVDVFHLLFPDPWPKRRHHYRRVFNADLLRLMARALRSDGKVRIATDDAAYFQDIQRVLERVDGFTVHADNPLITLPTTTFEKRFLERGLEIHRLVLRKVSDER